VSERWYTLTVDGCQSPPMTAARADEAIATIKKHGIGKVRTRRPAKDPGCVCMLTGDRRRCGRSLVGSKTTTELARVTCPLCLPHLTTRRRAWWVPPGLPPVVETLTGRRTGGGLFDPSAE